MIVTIDGPAGSGKSSAARLLAQRLGFEFLDTGAMYRAVTLSALQAGIDTRDEDALRELLRNFQLDMPPGQVLVNGADVTSRLRTSEVTASSGAIADSPAVRQCLGELQRAIAEGRDMVCEGRDQGTVVFPHASCKFFLVADPGERARRRHAELQSRGDIISWEDVLGAQEARDRRDAARNLAPMIPAPDATTIDTTHLSLDQVVARMEEQVRRCQSG